KAVAGQLRVLGHDDVQENGAAADLGLLDADIREEPLVPTGVDGPANALPGNGELVAHLQAAEELHRVGVARYAATHGDAPDGEFPRVAVVHGGHIQLLGGAGQGGK